MNRKTNPEDPIVITKRHIKKMIEQVKLIHNIAKNDVKESLLYPNFLKRESTDIIDACIRGVQSMFKREQNGFNKILYWEECFITNGTIDKNKINELKDNKETHIEHVIPKATLHHIIYDTMIKDFSSSLELQKTIIRSFLSPVALINREHIDKKNPLKIRDISHNNNPDFPFKRYNYSNIKVYLYNGKKIDNDTWSIEDHWELLRNTEYFKEIMNEFKI